MNSEHFAFMSLMKESKWKVEDSLWYLILEIWLGKLLLIIVNGSKWFLKAQVLFEVLRFLNFAFINQISWNVTIFDILYTNGKHFTSRFRIFHWKTLLVARKSYQFFVNFFCQLKMLSFLSSVFTRGLELVLVAILHTFYFY